jgi:NAD(P)-dependent dehydrogenase (short-subunit alcohol dehydrogenase family)
MATLLVTGAAGGIGRVVVERARARGDTVFAVVLQASDGSGLPAGDRLHIVQMDVSDTNSVAQGFEAVDRLLAGRTLDGVVHLAAVAAPGAIELTSMAQFEKLININALGSLRILKAAIPRLRGHGGRLVLVSSLWGRASGALLGAYCASKHAVESLADTARRETAGMNLHIIVAEPGVVHTEMLDGQGPTVQGHLDKLSTQERSLYGALYQRYVKLVRSSKGISAAQCAAGIEQALFAARPATRYRIGTDSTLVCFLNWLLPDRWMDGVMAQSLNNKPLPE